jgi:hypothetical protein
VVSFAFPDLGDVGDSCGPLPASLSHRPTGHRRFVTNKRLVPFDRSVTERSKPFLCPLLLPNRVQSLCFTHVQVPFFLPQSQSLNLPFLRFYFKQKMHPVHHQTPRNLLVEPDDRKSASQLGVEQSLP